MLRPALLALLVSPLASLSAQTGPFVDGELLVLAPGSDGLDAIYRINADNGDGELLLDEVYRAYSRSNWMAYDPHRDAILAYTAHKPLGLFSPRLYAIGSDGSIASLGFDDESLSALVPIGDGRVFCYRGTELSVLDAADNLQPILDAGGQPVDLYLDYLAYDVPTNSLIGVSIGNQASPCYQFKQLTAHRLPLNPAGTQLTGPIACASLDINAAGSPIGIDPLPGGDLVTTVSGASPFSDDVFVRIEPATLALSIWSSSTLNDVDGGVWCPAIQRVVTLDDGSDELRTFAPGQGGSGTPLPVDITLANGTSGVSTTNALTDIEIFGAPCAGFALPFGTGLAGQGGVVPTLTAANCPTLGSTVNLVLGDGVGGGLALLGIAGNSAAYPIFGGTGYLLPPFYVQLTVPLSGSTGAAGAGEAIIPIPTPLDPMLLGLPLYNQGAVLDPAAPQGLSLTGALEIQLG